MFEIEGYLDLSKIYDMPIKYVSLTSKFENRWVIVHNKKLDLWDCPGGRIELNETPYEAAKRELWEETGAVEAEYYPLFIFKMRTEEGHSYGVEYIVNITKFEALPNFEIDRIDFVMDLPYSKMRSPSVSEKLIVDIDKILKAGLTRLKTFT